MTKQDLKNQIQALKQLAKVIAPRPEWLNTNREILLMQIKNTASHQQPAEKFNWQKIWNFLDIFLPKQIVTYAVRPAVILILIGGLVLGSWVTTVSASYNSLPGDVLYSVKLATESVQTTLAAKPQSIKLRVDFAARRVEEVKQIVKSNLSKPQKEQKVEEAVKHLKSDLTQANTTMQEIKRDTTTRSAVMVEVAKAVDQRTSEIQQNLDQTNLQLVTQTTSTIKADNPMQEQVKQASAIAGDTSVKAVEILVQTRQTDQNSISAADVKTAVDNKLKTLEEKVVTIEQQIKDVASSTAATTDFSKEQKQTTNKLMQPAQQTNDAAKVSISQAKDELTKDNLGAALDKIKEGNALTLAAEVKADATKILTVPVSAVTSTVAKPADVSTAVTASTTSVVIPINITTTTSPEKKP